MRIILAGLLLALPVPVAADNANDIYAPLIGSWSPDGICIGREVIVTLDVNYIEFVETQCTLTEIHTTQGSLLLVATQCASEGEPSGNQTVQITPLADGSIDYITADTWRLMRCTDL